MLLNDIKTRAYREADSIDIQWDLLDDPMHKAQFVQTLERAIEFIPNLEQMYTQLQKGESVLFPQQESPLPYNDLEKYSDLLEAELESAYILDAVYTKYTLIENVLQSNTSF